VQKLVKRCRKLVGLLGCAGSAEASQVYDPAATRGDIPSSSHAASSSRLVDEEDEDEEEEEEEEEATHEEEEEEAYHEEEEDESNGEEEYDEDYGPPPTQSSQPSQLPKKRNPKPKTNVLSPEPFQRPIPRRARNKQPQEQPRETRSKRNEDRTGKRGRSN
jgi:hypothetical protein